MSDTGPSDYEVEQLVRGALVKRQGRATLGDVVRDTGIPLEKARVVLQEMLGLYRSHLSVSEDGDLLYEFDPALVRRRPPGFQTQMRRLLRWAYRMFVLGFKIATMVILVAYVLTFCVLIIAAVVALAAAGGDLDFDFGDIGDVGCFGWMIDLFVFWDTGTVDWVPILLIDGAGAQAGPARASQMRGLAPSLANIRPAEARRDFTPYYATDVYVAKRSKKHHFYEDVFAFVFGPQVPDPPPYAGERELVAWIADQKGTITQSELMMRTGLSQDEAEQEVTRLMVAFDGDARVTDDGELLYVFDEVRLTAGDNDAKSWPAPPSWQRFEPKQPLTGNSGGRNFLIGSMALFTLAMSVITPVFLFPILNIGTIFIIPLAVIPLLIAMGFFLIPMFRWPFVARENAGRYERNIRRAVLLAVARHRFFDTGPLPEDQVVQRVRAVLNDLQSLAGEGRDMPEQDGVSDADIRREFDKLAAELEADVEALPSGGSGYVFGRLRAEYDAAHHHRKGAAEQKAIGPIIYSSKDDEDDIAEIELPDSATASEEVEPLRDEWAEDDPAWASVGAEVKKEN